MTLLSLLLLIVPALLGIVTLGALRIVQEKIALITLGSTAGLVTVTSVLYGVSLFVAPHPLWLWIGMAICAGILGWLGSQHGKHIWQLPYDRGALLVLLAMIVITLLLAPKLLFMTDGDIATSFTNAWGDMGWHAANVTLFAEGQTVPPENPIFAGERLTYPFLVNFLSGALVAAGASITQAIVWPALLMIPIFFTLFFIFSQTITDRPRAAVIALLLVLFSGATLGWLDLRADLATSDLSVTEFLLHLPRDYSGHSTNESGFHFLNIMLAGLFPQRSLLFGLPLALGILLILIEGIRRQRTEFFIVAGVLSGLMPLAHAHTVIALLPVIIGLIILDLRNQQHRKLGASSPWIIYALTAAAIGLPEILYYFVGGAASNGTFFHWAPGWTVGENNIFLFWLKNTGLLIPLGLYGFISRGPRLAKLVAGSGFIIFLAANLFTFAPWAWDDYKLLIFWLLFTTPLIGLLLAKWLRNKHLAVVTVAVLLIVLHTHVAALDLIKTASPGAPVYGEWAADQIAMAETISANTTRNDVLITAPYHNNPVALAGRPLYLGFVGHVWSHGADPYQREANLRLLYTGLTPRLPDVPGSQYVVVGPVERANYPGLVIQDSWQRVAIAGAHELYRLP